MNASHDIVSARRSPLVLLAFLAGLVAILLVALPGPGWRFGLMHFRTGFTLMKYGAWLGIAAIVLGLIAAVVARPGGGRRGFAMAVAGLLLGLAAFLLPWSWRRSAQGVPPIHDITTDTNDPPPFVAIAPIRERDEATNPSAYEGDSIARLQREAYPEVRPVMIPVAPDSAFGVALAAAREMGWEIVDEDRAAGRIEATDVTGWWGFRDDVVIRVSPLSGISRVDIRSVSRVGRSDMGLNAKRIRAYMRELEERGGTVPDM